MLGFGEGIVGIMIWPSLGMRKRTGLLPMQRRRATTAVSLALQRQEADLNFVKRKQWIEEEVTQLPTGEHDYFERKSGLLFNPISRNNLLDALAKASSAFSNSGGGHLILG